MAMQFMLRLLLPLFPRYCMFIGNILWRVGVKVNCDGSVLHDLKATCDGLIHGAMGNFIGGFAADLGACPVTISKLWGAYYGLLLAGNKGWQ